MSKKSMIRPMKPSLVAFLVVLAITVLVWVLRGVRWLTFIPGGLLWVLILLCVATAVLSAVR